MGNKNLKRIGFLLILGFVVYLCFQAKVDTTEIEYWTWRGGFIVLGLIALFLVYKYGDVKTWAQKPVLVRSILGPIAIYASIFHVLPALLNGIRPKMGWIMLNWGVTWGIAWIIVIGCSLIAIDPNSSIDWKKKLGKGIVVWGVPGIILLSTLSYMRILDVDRLETVLKVETPEEAAARKAEEAYQARLAADLAKHGIKPSAMPTPAAPAPATPAPVVNETYALVETNKVEVIPGRSLPMKLPRKGTIVTRLQKLSRPQEEKWSIVSTKMSTELLEAEGLTEADMKYYSTRVGPLTPGEEVEAWENGLDYRVLFITSQSVTESSSNKPRTSPTVFCKVRPNRPNEDMSVSVRWILNEEVTKGKEVKFEK